MIDDELLPKVAEPIRMRLKRGWGFSLLMCRGLVRYFAVP